MWNPEQWATRKPSERRWDLHLYRQALKEARSVGQELYFEPEDATDSEIERDKPADYPDEVATPWEDIGRNSRNFRRWLAIDKATIPLVESLGDKKLEFFFDDGRAYQEPEDASEQEILRARGFAGSAELWKKDTREERNRYRNLTVDLAFARLGWHVACGTQPIGTTGATRDAIRVQGIAGQGVRGA